MSEFDKNTPTPRTDALAEKHGFKNQTHQETADEATAMEDLARQLERELAEAEEENDIRGITIDRLKEKIEHLSASSAEVSSDPSFLKLARRIWRDLRHALNDMSICKQCGSGDLYQAYRLRLDAFATHLGDTADYKGEYPFAASSEVTHPDTIALRAWHNAFGTTQLSHARARLEAAEKASSSHEVTPDAMTLDELRQAEADISAEIAKRYPKPSGIAQTDWTRARCVKEGHVWVGTGDERVVCDDCGIEKPIADRSATKERG